MSPPATIHQKRVVTFLRTGQTSFAQLPRNRELIHGYFSSANHYHIQADDCFFRFSSLLNFSVQESNFDLRAVTAAIANCVIFCIYCCGHVLARSCSAAMINNQQLSQFTAPELNLKKTSLQKMGKNGLPLLITRIVKIKFNCSMSKMHKCVFLSIFDG